MRPGLARSAAIVLALLCACGGGGDDPARDSEGRDGTEEAATRPDPAATGATETATVTTTGMDEPEGTAGWTTCRNDEQGFTVSHPEGWDTAAPSPAQQCRWLDREPIEATSGETPLAAIEIRDTIGEFQQAVEQLSNPFGERVIARDGLEIGGRRAVRFETELTEDFAFPEGTRRYGYVLDHGGNAFWIETRNPPGEDVPYAENKGIVDEAVRSVEFDEG